MARPSRKTTLIAGLAAGVVLVGGGAAVATGAVDDDTPITGPALDQASQAALAHVGEGTVADTEVGDEDSYYEVEVRLEDGRSVDVQLDEGFQVVGSETDGDEDEDAEDAEDGVEG